MTIGENSGRLDAINMTFALRAEIARSTIIHNGICHSSLQRQPPFLTMNSPRR